MSIVSPHRFYVYILAHPDGRPFYVGKGSRYRITEHDTEARSGHRCHKCNIIRQIWARGQEIQRYTVLTTDDEQEAFAYERELIALYGRHNLANLTDGGEGISGHIMSEATRRKMSIASRGVIPSAATRAKMSVSALRRFADPHEQERMRAQAHRYQAHPASRERSRRGALSQWADPEKRARLVAARQDRKTDPVWKARLQTMSDQALTVTAKHWRLTDPEGVVYHVVNLSAFCREHNLTPSAMMHVARGDNITHRGWRCEHDEAQP